MHQHLFYLCSTPQTARNRLTLLASNLTLALLGCLGSGAVGATEIEEVVVIADFRGISVMDAATSISVISSDVIRQRAAQHFEEIINTILTKFFITIRFINFCSIAYYIFFVFVPQLFEFLILSLSQLFFNSEDRITE